MDKITFNFETMKFVNITVTQVKLWESLYPDVDVVTVLLRDIPREIDKKVERRNGKIVKKGWIKNKKDWKRTIVNWLKKEQIKGVGL